MKTKLKITLLSLMLMIGAKSSIGQCASAANIYSFTFNGIDYEVVKENKTWADAAACAVERGGKLAEVDSGFEQDGLYNGIVNNAGINNSSTVAPDGGGASYVWIGGNDLATEGEWIWDGANTGSGAQFWQGTASGSAVGGLFNNWGNEPDDFGTGQDGLGFAITDWPLGITGQWNDVNDQNTLYYVIEYPSTAGIKEIDMGIEIYPNPVENTISLLNTENSKFSQLAVTSLSGEIVLRFDTNNEMPNTLDVSSLHSGFYFLEVQLEDGSSVAIKFQKH